MSLHPDPPLTARREERIRGRISEVLAVSNSEQNLRKERSKKKLSLIKDIPKKSLLQRSDLFSGSEVENKQKDSSNFIIPSTFRK